jgi:hypothetical protein
LLLLACGGPTPTPDGGTGGGTGGGAGDTILAVAEDVEVSDVVVSGDVAYFSGSRAGTGVIGSARLTDGAVTVTTLCEHPSSVVQTLVVQGTEVHGLTQAVLSAGKVLRTSTTSTGGACTVVGDATPLLLGGKAYRVGNALYYLGPTSGVTNPHVKSFDLASNTESQVTTGEVKVPPMGTDGTSLFFTEGQPGGSGLQVVRVTTSGANPTVMFTSTAATMGFGIAGGNLGWLSGDDLVFVPTQGTPGSPQTAVASLGIESVITFCGVGPSNTLVYASDRGAGVGRWTVPLTANATKTLVTTQYFSTRACAASAGALWWIDNVDTLRVKAR